MKLNKHEHPVPKSAPMPVRLIYVFLGLLSVGIGILGVFVPGLPTTIFLIIASYLLTRSCPWLEQKIMAMAIFKPFIPYVRRERPMPRKAKITALTMMWVCVSASLVLLSQRDTTAIWVYIAIVISAVIGTVFISRS